MALMVEQLESLEIQIQALNLRLLAWHKQDKTSQRLATIPGVGVISATALAASIADPGQFRSGREFSASLGLVPRQNSSGGKDRLGRISKIGDRYLRKLLVVGATSVVRRARGAKSNPWVGKLLERKPTRLVTVALAKKLPELSGQCWRGARPTTQLPPDTNRCPQRGGRRTARVPIGMMMTI